ncbi:MAG: hypothetical protein ABFC75_02595, partial [Rectinema sp.]
MEFKHARLSGGGRRRTLGETLARIDEYESHYKQVQKGAAAGIPEGGFHLDPPDAESVVDVATAPEDVVMRIGSPGMENEASEGRRIVTACDELWVSRYFTRSSMV